MSSLWLDNYVQKPLMALLLVDYSISTSNRDILIALTYLLHNKRSISYGDYDNPIQAL
jgi:hypothetical protein